MAPQSLLNNLNKSTMVSVRRIQTTTASSLFLIAASGAHAAFQLTILCGSSRTPSLLTQEAGCKCARQRRLPFATDRRSHHPQDRGQIPPRGPSRVAQCRASPFLGHFAERRSWLLPLPKSPPLS